MSGGKTCTVIRGPRELGPKEDEIATRAFISANSDTSRKTAIRSDYDYRNAKSEFTIAICEMASEKEPFVPINTNLKPYEITIPPPNDYNKGES